MPDTLFNQPALQRRLLQAADFGAALQLLPAWLALDEATRLQLPALWRELLHHPGFNADVIEDLGAPAGRRIQAIGMSIALDACWQQRVRDRPQPWITRHLYTALLEGRTRPPGEREMARANASHGDDQGLSFMVLHYQQHNTDMRDPQAVAVVSAGVTALRLAHAGHRVREIHQEAWQHEHAYMHSIGMLQRSTHNHDHHHDAGPRNAPLQVLPELFGLHRAEALRQLPGSHIREIFEHCTPVFGFSGAERRLLRRALFDEPDELVAVLMGVSSHTLKKLWRSIYERVEDRFPTLLADAAALGAEGVRGPEKRRTLMRYLRQHLEEVRPCAAVAGAVDRSGAAREPRRTSSPAAPWAPRTA